MKRSEEIRGVVMPYGLLLTVEMQSLKPYLQTPAGRVPRLGKYRRDVGEGWPMQWPSQYLVGLDTT